MLGGAKADIEQQAEEIQTSLMNKRGGLLTQFYLIEARRMFKFELVKGTEFDTWRFTISYGTTLLFTHHVFRSRRSY